MEQARRLHRTALELQRRLLTRQNVKLSSSTGRARELSVAQLTTLSVVRDRPGLSLKDLASSTGVSPPSASAMVDKLVEMGLLERRSSATDRREIRITVTPAGDEAAREHEGESLRTLVDLLHRVGPETARQWHEVYSRVQECLDRDKHSALIAK